MSLDFALGAMRSAVRWFLYALEWNAQEGKYEKFPCPPDGREIRINAADSANWMTYDQARDALARLPRSGAKCYTLGFWLTPDTGYFFFDLDGVNNGGALTADAQARVEQFPGALMEWSSSGTGLHIIGRTLSPVPSHRTRPKRGVDLPYEFYTGGRGIAFGLTGEANGSADSIHDAAVRALITDVFTAPTAGEVVRPEWRGPADDDELIQRMLAARESAEAAFGRKASLAQLWRGDTEKDSSHDMALAAHLAFWTGCDEERMHRLMLRSGMVRGKWTTHRTYLSLTINKAIAGCANVYQEPARATPKPPAALPAVRNASDLMKLDFLPVQWAIRDIIPEGVTILSGDPKLGKSFMVYQMCIAVASGSILWGARLPERKGDALYLDLEGNDRRLKRRLEVLLPAFPNADLSRLHYATDWPRAEEGVQQIAAWLRQHPEARIVVIDTISAFRDPDPGRKSAYATDYAAGEMLKPLTREFNCAIVLVMHNRKQASGDVMHKVSGTQGMTGSVDNVLVLERTRGDMDASLHVNGRDIEDEAELAMRFENGLWRCVGDLADVRRSKERNSVMEALTQIRSGTAREIHEAIGNDVKISALRMRLSRMVKAGEVICSGGIYMLPENFAPPPIPGV